MTISIFWTNFAQKGYFHTKTKKLNISIEFCMFELVQVPNFSLKWQFWFFGTNLPKKGVSTQNQKKWTASLNSAYSNYSSYQISASTDNFGFLDQIFPKTVFPFKNRKNEHHHWILHAKISVGTKFQLKVTILMFWTKFAQKGYFHSKTKKMNITIEFCMFELV